MKNNVLYNANEIYLINTSTRFQLPNVTFAKVDLQNMTWKSVTSKRHGKINPALIRTIAGKNYLDNSYNNSKNYQFSYRNVSGGKEQDKFVLFKLSELYFDGLSVLVPTAFLTREFPSCETPFASINFIKNFPDLKSEKVSVEKLQEAEEVINLKSEQSLKKGMELLTIFSQQEGFVK